jgi:hypothetical protein
MLSTSILVFECKPFGFSPTLFASLIIHNFMFITIDDEVRDVVLYFQIFNIKTLQHFLY